MVQVSKKFFLLVLFALFSLQLFSQETLNNTKIPVAEVLSTEEVLSTIDAITNSNETDTTSSLSEDNKDIVQNFSWEKVEYISKYQFIIETFDEETNEWVPFTEPIDTQENKVSLILPYGKFRYKIAVYNILDLWEYDTEWYNIEIFETFQPELRDVTPSVIYLEEVQDGIFSLNGMQLRPETKFELKNIRIPGSGNLVAKLIEEDDKFRRVKIQFDPLLLDSGTYELKVTNNGGLFDTFEPIKIQFKKPMDFNVSAGIAPVIFLFDDTISTYFNNNNIYPYAGAVRLTFIPIKKRLGYFGASLYGSFGYVGTSLWFTDTSFYDEHEYSITSGFLNTHLDFTYQKLLYKRMLVLDLHAGVGVMGFMNMTFKFSHDYESTPYNALNLTANGGLSMQFYILKRLFLEAGCDFTYTFAQIFNKSKIQIGFIQPTVQIGWQF